MDCSGFGLRSLACFSRPAIDSQCRFPWHGVPGCKGKDTRAMLRLTVSDDMSVRNQLGNNRELSLAKTKIEEAVMWAVKHITM